VLIPLLTMQPIEVFDQTLNHQLQLMGYPDSTHVYFREDRDGLGQNLTSYNIQTKSVDKQFKNLNQNGLLAKLTFSRDMNWGFMANETQIIRIDLQTQ